MTDTKKTDGTESDAKEKKTLSLSGGGAKSTLSLKGNTASRVRQNIQTRSGVSGVSVEVRRRRAGPAQAEEDKNEGSALRQLTSEERDARARALKEALAEDEKKRQERTRAALAARETQEKKMAAAAVTPEEEARQKELQELQRIEEDERKKSAESERINLEHEELFKLNTAAQQKNLKENPDQLQDDDSQASMRDRLKRNAKPPARSRSGGDRRGGKMTVNQVLNQDYDRDRGPSMAAQRRAKERARRMAGPIEPAQKVYREVVLPEAITVQELANRMSERGTDVIKALMKMGMMVTINQILDADTAELVVQEMGHKVKRVTEADVEEGLGGEEDPKETLQPRPPIVTIMGHVDHGKTSLLDALRTTDVASGEAGGITQHIGAYQIEMQSGDKITFLDTPGHAAFTEMRARGANVTDIVVLVVAADDSVMPQTIEAISHAKAAKVPMIVAINKIDKPDANPTKIRQDLLQYEVIGEDMGGDVQMVEISAKQKKNLDKLEEAILIQAEILELKANPDREAHGVVIESKMERGRGSVATILIQKGTLNVGDIYVVGQEWGRVRALINDHGKNVKSAVPGQPVEVIGLNGTPAAGDSFDVVEDEGRARDVAEYRLRKRRDAQSAANLKNRTTLDDLLQAAKEGEKKTLPVIIKADVHGSLEAISGSLAKITEENPEVGVSILHSGVGGITETDVTLAAASKALIIGFNVRANAQARDQAQRDEVDVRYYNVIYNVIDDAKAILSGMLSPITREEYIGRAEIRQVFNITKVGKVGGCMVVDGFVKRGSGVRLLRDDVVIHEGKLKTLKRFKDEVKEVNEGMECGMAFAGYDNIQEGDIIECYETVSEERSL